ncbi:OLC1v1034371C1 [Oldenlandia corymbosa var. corymbosa]|uniref:OLC1v1034371C1 n=1 Tax=Oldenlandia corymbosa var. corymbosa TaxID=529605 RepID=A0AAV1CTE1_OLDCO|nr:OLC1v1034371C1 [Oldenlandia corymbosa var. corymbosa]
MMTSKPSSQGVERLPFRPEGYNFWTWRGRNIHYVVEGEGTPIVLLHGLGGSAFHWRYNIPELGKRYKVFALDLLGFGWSEKPIIDYDALVWRDQVVDFVKEVVQEPAVLVGNSLGGSTALLAATVLQDQVRGVSLLNTDGVFGDPKSDDKESDDSFLHKYILTPFEGVFRLLCLGCVFWPLKQRWSVKCLLKTIYKDSSNVDDYLIDSVTMPAADPNAGQVHYNALRRFFVDQKKYTLNSVLTRLSCPLLLVWGELDTSIPPAKAVRIKEFYPKTTIVLVHAGHCPHDEAPEPVNRALSDWVSTLTSTTIGTP